MAEDAPGEHEQMHLPAPTVTSFRREEGPAIEDTVSPPREEKHINASTLSFPLQLVLMFGGILVSAYGAAWTAQSSQREAMAQMRSDIRNISTLMASQKELAEKDFIIWQERFEAMKRQAEQDAELRRVLLKQYEQSNTEFQKKMLAR